LRLFGGGDCDLLEVGGGEGGFAASDGEECGVELDEGGVDGGVVGVAGVAGCCCGGHFGGFGVVEAEEGPLAGEAGLVFDVDFEAHAVGALEVALLVDGTSAFGAADFEDQHGFVGPGAGLEEGFVRFGIDEDVVEHVVIGCLRVGVVAHVEAGGEVDPFAIVFGELELAVVGVLDDRGGCRGGRGCGERGEKDCGESCCFGERDHVGSMREGLLGR
jgi:hypothetical protein